MGHQMEVVFNNILKDSENTRSGGGVGRKFVTTKKPGRGYGVRAGDRFRRCRARSMLRTRALSGVTKATNNSVGDISTARKAGLFTDIWHLMQDSAISSTAISPTKPTIIKEVKEDVTSVGSAMDKSTTGEDINEFSGNHTRKCGGEGDKADHRETPRQSHEALMAYIKQIRAKSNTLLRDVKQLRYDLRIYPF